MFRDINWLEDCPACKHSVLRVEDAERHTVHDGKPAHCADCGLGGTIEVFDKESVGVYWDAEEYN
ncbi:hypothetical protein NVP1077O_35 [Vibrio phage 1.077.O._10N.261.45.A10]|nr:hypothetical protein NVP1077O_35 [Vibrio phage 1.077.O._10N.261.45.A10]